MTYMVLGNWKAHGTTAMVTAFASDFHMPTGPTAAQTKLGLALPFHLVHLGQGLPGLWVGAQNVSAYGEGAYTGEITAGMLHEAGCRFCLVGHSERRRLFGETVDVTHAKLAKLVDAGITPVFCIGETLEERRAGRLEEVLTKQLAPVADLNPGGHFAVAYEPVWAIGTGVAASLEDAAEAHAHVKRRLADAGLGHSAVLYGGSVKPKNAAELAACDDIDGFLVGGASLKGADLAAIAAGFCKGKDARA